jgi:hypothetical protein
MIFDTLSYIAKELNAQGVLWGIGASIVLHHYSLVDSPNDIDILVDIKDIQNVDMILENLGIKKLTEKIDTYSTRYFYEYVINAIDVDVMAGFTLNHSNGEYIYSFDHKSITSVTNMNGIDIPLTSLEDWYVIYQLIPGRENKVKIIEDYLLENGLKSPNLLNRALTKVLPEEVRFRIQNLLASQH